MAMKKRKCRRCKKLLPLTSFGRHKSARDGIAYKCRECANAVARESRKRNPEKAKARLKRYRSKESTKKKTKARNRINSLKRWYGMTETDYSKMLKNQDGVCAICSRKETHMGVLGKEPRQLSVDHNHETGKVRGLLCARCNVAIGYFREDVKVLKNVLKYLKKRGG